MSRAIKVKDLLNQGLALKKTSRTLVFLAVKKMILNNK